MTAVAASGYAAPQGLLDFMRARPLHEWADASGQRWAWRDSGTAAPGVALLPGALGNGDVAWKIAQALERDFRVLTIHYPSGVGPVRLSQGLHELLEHLRHHTPILTTIAETGAWDDDLARATGEVIDAFKLGFITGDGKPLASGEEAAEAIEAADLEAEQIVVKKKRS